MKKRIADGGWRIADGSERASRVSTSSLLHRDCANGTERMDAREWPQPPALSSLGSREARATRLARRCAL